MRLDALLSFVPLGSNLSLIGPSNVGIPGINIIDMLGQGVGQAPGNIIGNAATFGTDMGVGGIRPELLTLLGTTCAGAPLNVALQAAADTGIGGNYQPGTWQTIVESGAIPVANLLAGVAVGRFPWVPQMPANLRARYLRMLFTPVGAAMTAGAISCSTVTIVRDDLAQKYAAKNYSVA